MITQLAKGEMTVMKLAEPFKMSLPAVSKHLKVLEKAGLVAYLINKFGGYFID
jgi:DNA-binding transcriptional ArsR family regulator